MVIPTQLGLIDRANLCLWTYILSPVQRRRISPSIVPIEYVQPEDGNRIQSLKSYVLNKRLDEE
jgi:hypothetical protein